MCVARVKDARRGGRMCVARGKDARRGGRMCVARGKTPAAAGVCVWRGWVLYRRCGECGVDFAFDVEVVVEDGVEILSQEIDAFFL